MEEKSHKWIYVIIIVVIVALMVAGALLYRDVKVTNEAQQKAKEFVTLLQDAGLPAPTEEQAVRLYGADGGPFAGSPDADLAQAEYGWWHGTAGAANRPFRLQGDYIEAARIFVAVYTPEKLAAFDEYVAGLETDDSQ
jgi:hypothetical protein